jgi:predicted transcriptional regulator YdeE
MTIVGLGYHGKNDAGEVPQLWGALMARAEEIKDRDYAIRAAYGISIMGPDYEETMIFDYIAGFPVEGTGEDLPEGMAKYTIPEGQYVEITCPNLDSIGKAYDAVYRWAEQSDKYEIDLTKGNFCFELYGEEFMPDQGSELFYIYVPVKTK